jgi:hypothetical protein
MAPARTHQCPSWVKRVGFVMSAVCPVYPQQQTSPDTFGTSHLCHELTLEALVGPSTRLPNPDTLPYATPFPLVRDRRIETRPNVA